MDKLKDNSLVIGAMALLLLAHGVWLSLQGAVQSPRPVAIPYRCAAPEPPSEAPAISQPHVAKPSAIIFQLIPSTQVAETP